MKFLDTNIVLRYLTKDDPAKAKDCFELFQKLKVGSEEVLISEAVITEVVYVLFSKRLPYQLTHEEIRSRLVPILNLRGLKIAQKRLYLRALEHYVASPFLDIEDAVAIAHMEKLGIREIISYDTDFDRIPNLKRVEP